ncbi:MAG TPA: alpha/beta fold hydrolase [Pseudomonas sp.]|nr:alpha/beta fold hydrolase [Pseudomonas sp.]
MHKHRPAEAGTAPTRFSARQTIIGLRGRDLRSSLGLLLTQGLRQPLHGLRNGLELTGKLARVLRGETLHPVGDDPRFADPTWHLNPLYRRGLQAYLACQQQCLDWIEGSNLSAEDRDRVRFLVRQLTQALSPSNGPLNPQALKECFDTGGASLARGLRQLLHDLPRGMPNQVPPGVFRLGANLATSRGAVVLRNEVLELIQYQPMTPQRHAVPLLIVPAQLNKFYIFDLNARKSFVQYCLKQNIQVFMVSWRNPDRSHREWGLSSYVQALREALEACRSISGGEQVNLVGACAGGLTIAALQGYLQAVGQLDQVASATYLVSLLDSQLDATPLLFVHEEDLESAKRHSYQQGVLDGRELARLFAWMRPSELIWPFWVNNYLLGRQPPPNDILYWNNDSTRLPAALHGELLDFFKFNPLLRPGGLEVCGQPVDLSQVTVDSFSVAGRNDHITPWEAVFRSARLLGGQRRFLLVNSGHVQSVINPPGTNPKASYQDLEQLDGQQPQAWASDSPVRKGSWWPLWINWLQAHAGPLQPARETLGNEAYPAQEAAPGLYVLQRLEATG